MRAPDYISASRHMEEAIVCFARAQKPEYRFQKDRLVIDGVVHVALASVALQGGLPDVGAGMVSEAQAPVCPDWPPTHAVTERTQGR